MTPIQKKFNNAQQYLPIENNTKLVRDTYSHAIINKDLTALNRAKAQKESILAMHKKLDETSKEINTLKTQMRVLEGIVKSYCAK